MNYCFRHSGKVNPNREKIRRPTAEIGSTILYKGVVVHDNHLEVLSWIGLRFQRANAALQSCPVVMSRDDDRDERQPFDHWLPRIFFVGY